MIQFRKHIILLVGLVVLSLTLYLTKAIPSRNNINHDLFALNDTSEVQNISIRKKNKVINVSRIEDNWILNDSLKVDQSLIQIFNVIMSKVQVLRPVSPINFEEIKKDMIEKGQLVTLNLSAKKFEFYTGGNAAKTQAYFADSELNNIYLVMIPGHNNYLSGIFELTLNQWRDRTLFASSWRTIQSLEIKYNSSLADDLHIYFDKKFMNVKGVSSLDTVTLMNYLSQFEQFQVNDYLNEGEFIRFDSLMNTAPIAHIELKDIDKSRNRSLNIYQKIPKQQFYLFSSIQNQMIVIDQSRVNNLLKSPSFFQRK
ncbi:MAG: hypothetical protein JXR07_04320 [Reichenbachiella sp.]